MVRPTAKSGEQPTNNKSSVYSNISFILVISVYKAEVNYVNSTEC